MREVTVNGRQILVHEKLYQEILQEAIDINNWIPELGETYYYIDSNGVVTVRTYAGNAADYWKIDCQNCFKTKEDAMRYRDTEIDRLRAIYNVKRFMADNGLSFSPDWKKDTEAKWHIAYDHKKDDFYGMSSYSSQHGSEFFFASNSDLKKVVLAKEGELRVIFRLC